MEHDYYERVANFLDAKRMYQGSAAGGGGAVERFRPFTREVAVAVGRGNDLLARCVAAVLKEEWRLAYPGDGFSGDPGGGGGSGGGGGGVEEALDLDGLPVRFFVMEFGFSLFSCFNDQFTLYCKGVSLKWCRFA